MSLFESVFNPGGKQRRDAERTFGQNVSSLTGANNRALQFQNQGMDNARGNVARGTAAYSGRISDGFNEGRQQMGLGYEQERSDLTGGIDRASTALDGAMERTRGVLNPVIEQSNGANDLYNNFLGVNGADVQRQSLDQYEAGDPFREYNQDLTRAAAERAANARGAVYDPRTETAIARVSQERQSQDYNNYLDRLFTQVGRGDNARSQLAGYEQGAGANQANLQASLGRDLAQSANRYYGGMSDMDTQEAGLIGGAEQGMYANLANMDMQQGNYLGAAERDLASTIAGQRTSLSNLRNSTYDAGLNRALQVAGLGIDAFTPVPSGIANGRTIYRSPAQSVGDMFS